MKSNIFISEESGQGMVEYGLILVLVALAALGAIGAVGKNSIQPMYEKIKDIFPEPCAAK